MNIPEKSKPTRKERYRERHRQEILEAAERVFGQKGYHAATVEEIAQEAEFSVGTLYNFFKNKVDLYAQVSKKILQDFAALLEQRVLSQANPVEAIGALIEFRLTFFENHRWFFRAFFESSPESRGDVTRALPVEAFDSHDRYTEAVSRIFARGIQEGLFAPADPLYLSLSLDGIIQSVGGYWSRQESRETLEQRIENMKSTFLRWIQKRA